MSIKSMDFVNASKKVIAKAFPNSSKLRTLSWAPLLEDWKTERGKIEVFKNRFNLYDYINKEELGGERMCYLEFGVYKGESIRYWSDIHDNDESKLFGFDTFEGLPESWDSFTRTREGTFDTSGEPPQIEDSRVEFIKGMFQETLPSFLENFPPPKRKLVVNIDSDIYTSALYVLTKADNIIKPGSIIIFDEFSSVLHEFRAFVDYTESYMRNYEVIGSSGLYLNRVAVRITE